VKEGRDNHYIVFVTFLGKIGDPRVSPEVYVVPSKELSAPVSAQGPIYQNPGKTRRVVPLVRARKHWNEYAHAWQLLR
jgi:hypothetical protein